ncbi:MAG: 6-phosphogluconolactonase [Acidobacteria bacterium]|nr:6-phosphogluconolactonase [Acidobacteriota bacterium]
MAIQWHERPDLETAAEAAAQYVIGRLEEARKDRGFATLALSGGTTPQVLFARLAASPFRWDGVHVFWVDERVVPPAHSDSNYRLAQEALLGPARIPEGQIHRIRAELPAESAAQQYTENIRQFFRLTEGTLPSFDVLHLGLGADGHTASLFPGEALVDDRSGIAAAVHVAKLTTWRITLLPGVLLAARQILFFTAGGEKAPIIHTVLHEPYDPHRWPSQIVIHSGRNVAWFLGGPR